jgi:enoyl-CoA hydratase/carnithine racemase
VLHADEAFWLGFLNRSVAEEDAEFEAISLARAIADNNSEGVRRLKRMLRDFEGLGPAERVTRENEILVDWQRSGAGLPAAPSDHAD